MIKWFKKRTPDESKATSSVSAPKPFWTIGLEREKLHVAKYAKKPEQQSLLFPLIEAALELNKGKGDEAHFLGLARAAMVDGDALVWKEASSWILKISHRYESLSSLWPELAAHESWQLRWRVACLLYSDIPEEQSDRLFAALRRDKSTKVREYSIDQLGQMVVGSYSGCLIPTILLRPDFPSGLSGGVDSGKRRLRTTISRLLCCQGFCRHRSLAADQRETWNAVAGQASCADLAISNVPFPPLQTLERPANLSH